MKIESSIKQIPHAQPSVYATLSDLSNVEKLKDRMADMPESSDENVKKAAEKLKEMTFDRDSISMAVNPIGQVTMRIVEREEPKLVKFQSENSPLSFKLWIQILPTGDESSKMRLTIDADVPFFAKSMVEGPLTNVVEQIADTLARIPY